MALFLSPVSGHGIMELLQKEGPFSKGEFHISREDGFGIESSGISAKAYALLLQKFQVPHTKESIPEVRSLV